MPDSKSTVFFNLIPNLPVDEFVQSQISNVIYEETLPATGDYKETRFEFRRAKSADNVTIYFINLFNGSIQRHRYIVEMGATGRQPSQFIAPEYEEQLIEIIMSAFRAMMKYGSDEAGMMRWRGVMNSLSVAQFQVIQEWEHRQKALAFGYKILGFKCDNGVIVEPIIDTGEDATISAEAVAPAVPDAFSDFISGLGGLDDL